MTKYRVRKGDTLWHIAQVQYGKGSMWPLISRANRIPKSNRILAGMTLNLPDPPGSKTVAYGPPVPYGPPAPVSRPAAPVLAPEIPSVADAVAMQQAVEVRYPAAKYTLENTIAEVKDSNFVYSAKVTLSGTLTLQKLGTMPHVEVTSNIRTLEPPDSIEYSAAAGKIVSPTMSIDREKGRVGVGFNSPGPDDKSETSLDMGFGVEGAYARSKSKNVVIKGVYEGFAYEGSLECEIEIDQSWWQIAGDVVVAGVVVGVAVVVVDGTAVIVVEELVAAGGRWVLVAGAEAVGEVEAVARSVASISWRAAQIGFERLTASAGETAYSW